MRRFGSGGLSVKTLTAAPLPSGAFRGHWRRGWLLMGLGSVLIVNVLTDLGQLLPFMMHGDSVTRYIDANASVGTHFIPDNFSVKIDAIDKTALVAGVS